MELTKEDVWGEFDLKAMKRISFGMVVARGLPLGEAQKNFDYPIVCPIWGDRLPYKAVTVICNPEQENEVEYWLSYVHGGDCIGARKTLPDGRIALRSNYMCW